jgi:hypothetical protein
MHRSPAATTAHEQRRAPELAPIFVMYIKMADHASTERKLIRGQKRAANKMQHSTTRVIFQNGG